MQILYHCYGQAHSSITAANLHLGRLPQGQRPTLAQILAQPGFDETPHAGIGTPRLMGTDPQGHQVYAMGLGDGRRVMVKAVAEFLRLNGVAAEQFLLVDALQPVGLLLRVGGFLSRRLALVWPGRPLAALGVWWNYPGFLALVGGVRAQLERGQIAVNLDQSLLFQDNDLDRAR